MVQALGCQHPSEKGGAWKLLATTSGQNLFALAAKAGLPPSSLILACCLLIGCLYWSTDTASSLHFLETAVSRAV